MTTKETKTNEVRRKKNEGNVRREYLRGKFQQAMENLKKKGKGSDTSDEEETEKKGNSDKEIELPELIGSSLNMSKKNLREFPERFLKNMNRVQYLYLEGNKLAQLPQNFFQNLYLLKWLDLRNNELTSLPTSGLKHHTCLEVVLLQGNRIRNLPVELATIQTLKGLQTTGNPITNVPYEVIAGGFQQVIKHLEKLHSQNEILLPVSDTILVKPSTSRDHPLGGNPPPEENEPTDAELRMWDLDKLSGWRHFMKRKSTSVTETNLKDSVAKPSNDKLVLQQPKISVSLRSQPKPLAKPQPFRCGVYNKNRHRTASRALCYLKMRKMRLGYRRKPVTMAMIQEKARVEAYKAQMRETLEKQAKKIQRLRDKEVLKNWRDHAKITSQQIKLLDNYQQYPSKDFASKTPFDVDPEFLTMLNRMDLYRSLKDYDNRSKRRKKPKVRITALDLERQMNEIMQKLQKLDANDGEENLSPRKNYSHACSKINKIMDIQKALKNLQTLNSSMNGVMPIMKTKPKH